MHSVFLRKECILPNRLGTLQQAMDNNWAMVEDLPALVFDSIIRQAGWHFVWIEGSLARRGFGISRQSATDRALASALNGVEQQFNAAELDCIQVAKYFGFHIATVTVQPRQIQQDTSLALPRA